MSQPPDLQLIATSAFGLEAVVVRELRKLGYEAGQVTPGRIRFSGDPRAVCRSNLWLRTADRVLLEVGRFSCDDFETLFQQTRALPWAELLPADASFPVRGKCVRSKLSSLPACQRTVKKAVVEALQQGHRTQRLPEDGGTFGVEISLCDDEAVLSIDTSGTGLHKRGYGQEVGPAPLKETLAAGLVLLSFWDADRPLWDPFCGSGTLCIEAAMIGRNLAPGANRFFAARRWPLTPRALWDEAVEEAADLAARQRQLDIFGSDVDPKAIGLAKRRWQTADVGEGARFQLHDACGPVPVLENFGCVISNPPYGERLGERRQSEDLYRQLPDALAQLPTWSHFLISSHTKFERIVGRGADRRRKLFNGRIACTYYQFHGPPPSANPDTVQPVFGGEAPDTGLEAEQLATRLRKRVRHFRRWPTRQGIHCYRLYDCDVPNVALTIDRYHDFLLIADHSQPQARPPGTQGHWLAAMTKVAIEVVGCNEHAILSRCVSERPPETKMVEEAGMAFEVCLGDHMDTGLPLVQRELRSIVREQAEGKRLLHLFCHTGAIAVAAATGGAASSCSVTPSKRYRGWAERNRARNGLDPEAHRILHHDAATYLPPDDAECFDLIVATPPEFAAEKGIQSAWDLQADHVAFLQRVLDLLAPGGCCYFVVESPGFVFDPEQMLGAYAARDSTGRFQPEDFRADCDFRCWLLRAPA